VLTTAAMVAERPSEADEGPGAGHMHGMGGMGGMGM
jgi:hypothetical protein